MRKIFFNAFKVLITRHHILVGFLTFLFGFAVPALLNIFLLFIKSPLVIQFRGSLNFISSILGDGIVLPIVNMLIASFLIKNRGLIRSTYFLIAFISGFLITFYFKSVQATQGLVNWSMLKPWNWNILGFFHGAYMFSVASLVSLFYLIFIIYAFKVKKFTAVPLWVTGGIVVFFILLRLDYVSVNISSILP